MFPYYSRRVRERREEGDNFRWAKEKSDVRRTKRERTHQLALTVSLDNAQLELWLLSFFDLQVIEVDSTLRSL